MIVLTFPPASAKLGYRRNSNAASLRSNQTDMVVVGVPNIENALFSELVSAIEHRAVAERKGVMFMTTGEDQERAHRQIQGLVSRRVDGLIITPSFDYQPLLAKLEMYGIPVILADRIPRGHKCDDEGGRYSPCRHRYRNLSQRKQAVAAIDPRGMFDFDRQTAK